jgi:aspartyl/asparaginyl-tRNA synthetase
MKETVEFDFLVRKLRQFFQDQKGFIEVPAQSRLSILAACEQPQTITQYMLGGACYPLPQTGQMWLEHEILQNPKWPGVFCVTTSYRDEPHPIEGRHQRIFPMFEFEAGGDFDDLRQLEKELLEHLGFPRPVSITYTDACSKYQTETIEAEHELALAREFGPSISLEYFPEHTNPFWNMRYAGNGVYHKIDVLLHGMETIGSALRENDTARMLDQFYKIENGEYSRLLISKFGQERVQRELDRYLSLPMRQRFGGGIGMTRLMRAMQMEGLFGVQDRECRMSLEPIAAAAR